MNEDLVRVNKLSKKIKELPFHKRIETNMPILVRPKVAIMLKKASVLLPNGISLQVDGGFRSRSTEEILWKNRIKTIGIIKTKRIVGNPEKEFLSHTTGGAVDVSLLDKNLNEINLSAPFQKYYDEQKLYSKRITRESQKLRILLHNAMIQAGFAPHENEYWHFSYGDSRWARYYKVNLIYSEIREYHKYFYPFTIRFLLKLKRKILKTIDLALNKKSNY